MCDSRLAATRSGNWLLRLAGYAAILAAAALRGQAARLAAVGMSAAGAGFSAYLTYRELLTIDAVCQWCVAGAVVMCALAGLSVVRFLRA